MKKLIVCLAVAVLAFAPAMQAGEAKTCDAAKAACPDKAKLTSASTAKAACADSAKVVSATKAKDACCAKVTTAKRNSNSKGGAAALLAKN